MTGPTRARRSSGQAGPHRLFWAAGAVSGLAAIVAMECGWVVTEVGRQPWVVYGVLRTADAVTPFLTARTVAVSLAVYCVVYSFIFAFGTYYIYRLLRTGPTEPLVSPPAAAVPNRPMSVVDEHHRAQPAHHVPAGE